MDIIAEIRRKKAGKRKSCRPSLTTVICVVIDAYHLGEDYLDFLAKPLREVYGETPPNFGSRPKNRIEIPIFYMASRSTYFLAKEIIKKRSNPFLEYSRDPLEIYLSKPLHESNPLLERGKLLRYHFETLLMGSHKLKELKEE